MNQQSKKLARVSIVASVVLLVLGCASTGLMASDDDLSLRSDPVAVKATLVKSFRYSEQAGPDRLDQTEDQHACTEHAFKPLPADRIAALEKAALAAIKYPSDGNYLGDWKKGQKLAIGGTGMTYRDKPGSRVDGNCYACHQLETAEVSYGTIGPSLNNYGKKRGNSDAILKYTWSRLWNSHAYKACNPMPRFGAAGILSESDLKDIMALLHDPASVVNQ